MTEDEMCVAWLRKRDYHVVITGHVTWLRQRHVTAFEHREVCTEDMSSWVHRQSSRTGTYSVTLHKVQGKERRPLRSLVKEWMLDL